ncbi:hypothetical protein QFC22_004508 [Naganishia vaughanmartiniae]|uniref:Uncharacterized protein n=1 Tax=Naganishia vaughanmartiniae TaxID=1424756 RepID=A0ACC2X0C2_9TREE|nr:hypothetical protein QFC22_004508 [Naganishia vaughanmartiniae]
MLLRKATTSTFQLICPRVVRPLFARRRLEVPHVNHITGHRWNSGAQAAPVHSQSKQTADPEQDQKSDPSHTGQLAKLIADSIKITGPLPVARYMQFCLGHPTQGYYTRKRGGTPPATATGFDKDPKQVPVLDETTSNVLKQVENDVFGRKGDFITSPEISQMFGELIGVWFLSQWAAQGQPKKVRIVELGPGRGTLLDDILRTFRAVPSFPINFLKTVDLVETSEPLRAQQREKIQTRLNTFGGHGSAVKLNFWNWIGEVPVEKDTFTMVLAHEFFDALPINVFQRTEESWREVCVNFDPEWTSSSAVCSSPHIPADQASSTPATQANSGLTLAVSREPTTLSQVLPATSDRFASVPVGGRVEISKDSFETMRMVGQLISATRDEDTSADQSSRAGGAGLVIDYGADGYSSNSFRAFRRHEIVHVFDDPGSADLTANVDFAYMKEALEGAATPHGPINQRTFLTSLGLAPRLDKLLQSAKTKERKLDIANAARRLVNENGMGGEYQFLGITPKNAVAEDQSKQPTPVYPFETGSP